MDVSTLLTVSGSVLVAIVTVSGTILVSRRNAAVAVDAAISDKFNRLTDQLQEERTDLRRIVQEQRSELEAAHLQIDGFEKLMRLMRRHVDDLEARMDAAGIPRPPRMGWE